MQKIHGDALSAIPDGPDNDAARQQLLDAWKEEKAGFSTKLDQDQEDIKKHQAELDSMINRKFGAPDIANVLQSYSDCV